MMYDTTLARQVVDDSLSAVHNAAEAWHHDPDFHAFAEGLVPILAAVELAGRIEEIPPARVRRMLRQACSDLLSKGVEGSVNRQQARKVERLAAKRLVAVPPELREFLPPGIPVVYDTSLPDERP